MNLRDAEAGEKRPQVAAEDLPGRPPERFVRDLRCVSASALELDVHERRPFLAQKEGAEDRFEWMRVHIDAGQARDGNGRSVGLKGGDSSLFDGEVRAVPGREDSVEPAHAPELVHWQEARTVRG